MAARACTMQRAPCHAMSGDARQRSVASKTAMPGAHLSIQDSQLAAQPLHALLCSVDRCRVGRQWIGCFSYSKHTWPACAPSLQQEHGAWSSSTDCQLRNREQTLTYTHWKQQLSLKGSRSTATTRCPPPAPSLPTCEGAEVALQVKPPLLELSDASGRGSRGVLRAAAGSCKAVCGAAASDAVVPWQRGCPLQRLGAARPPWACGSGLPGRRRCSGLPRLAAPAAAQLADGAREARQRAALAALHAAREQMGRGGGMAG